MVSDSLDEESTDGDILLSQAIPLVVSRLVDLSVQDASLEFIVRYAYGLDDNSLSEMISSQQSRSVIHEGLHALGTFTHSHLLSNHKERIIELATKGRNQGSTNALAGELLIKHFEHFEFSADDVSQLLNHKRSSVVRTGLQIAKKCPRIVVEELSARLLELREDRNHKVASLANHLCAKIGLLYKQEDAVGVEVSPLVMNQQSEANEDSVSFVASTEEPEVIVYNQEEATIVIPKNTVT